MNVITWALAADGFSEFVLVSNFLLPAIIFEPAGFGGAANDTMVTSHVFFRIHQCISFVRSFSKG